MYSTPTTSLVSVRRAGADLGSGAGGVHGLPIPGQEFGDASRRMVGDAGEHVGKVMLRVEAVELGTFNQRIDRGGAAAAGIGAGEQIIFTANGDAAQGTLGGIVVECQAAIVEAAHQCSPARPHVAEGL